MTRPAARPLRNPNVSGSILIDTIVFDLGAVLIDWNPRYLFRKLISDEKAMEKFLSEVCNHDWNIQQDAGRPFAEAVVELTAKFPEHKELIRAYHQRWPEMLAGSIDGTVDILQTLHSHCDYRLLALTNWSAETFPVAKTKFSFLELFDGIVVSGAEKLIKPDPRLYTVLQDRYHVNPSRSVFIDDSEKNVNAAKNLGYHSILFTNPSDLRRDLVSIGVRI